MKFVLLALLAALSIFIGYIFSRKYRLRANFFQALVLLCQKFDVEINYSRERLKNIFSSLDQKQKDNLSGIDNNYISFIDKESPLEKEFLFKNINFLKDSEKDLIFMFFKNLGRSDVDSQSKEIKNFQARFENLSSQAHTENKKYGALSIKLGIIGALVVVIILI